eukprot:2585889-Pleurochrysis_carterae.AAC.1
MVEGRAHGRRPVLGHQPCRRGASRVVGERVAANTVHPARVGGDYIRVPSASMAAKRFCGARGTPSSSSSSRSAT